MLRWGRVVGLVLTIVASACGAEVAVENTAPTLPPLEIPIAATVPPNGSSSTTVVEPPPTVDLPEILDLAAFDIFGRLAVEQYEVNYRMVGAGIDQEAVYTYQRDPLAGHIVGIADGDEIEVVLVGDEVWARFGPTPDGALVEASTTFAALADGFFEPGAIAAQNLEPFDFRIGDFVLVGPGDFEGEAAFEYAAPEPRRFSWWVDGDGLILGGAGVVGTDSDAADLSFRYRWSEVSDRIVRPTNTISQEEYFAFLEGQDPNDPTRLQEDLRSVQAAVARSRVNDGLFGTEELDGMVRLGLIDGWQPTLDDLRPGTVGVLIEQDSALLVAAMADGRHYCVAMAGDAITYGASYTIADLIAPDGCSVPTEFPPLDPAG